MAVTETTAQGEPDDPPPAPAHLRPLPAELIEGLDPEQLGLLVDIEARAVGAGEAVEARADLVAGLVAAGLVRAVGGHRYVPTRSGVLAIADLRDWRVAHGAALRTGTPVPAFRVRAGVDPDVLALGREIYLRATAGSPRLSPVEAIALARDWIAVEREG